MSEPFPTLRSVVLDAADPRDLAEFYRQLLGYRYRPGDEPAPEGDVDDKAGAWLVLLDTAGHSRLCFQGVEHLPPSTWPDEGVAQQLHLDLSVRSAEELTVQRERALALGARQLHDRFDHPTEPLYVFADPAGHPFCMYVSDPGTPDESG